NLISTTYTLKEKNYLLTILLLNNMGNDLAHYDQYFTKFINEPKNLYKSLVKDNYAIYSSDYKDQHDKDSTFLFSPDNTRHLWADLLDQYHDQVILVDFWASYCQPCREEMPQTFQLLKKYKEKGLVCLFVSIDPLKTNWVGAVND